MSLAALILAHKDVFEVMSEFLNARIPQDVLCIPRLSVILKRLLPHVLVRLGHHPVALAIRCLRYAPAVARLDMNRCKHMEDARTRREVYCLFISCRRFGMSVPGLQTMQPHLFVLIHKPPLRGTRLRLTACIAWGSFCMLLNIPL